MDASPMFALKDVPYLVEQTQNNEAVHEAVYVRGGTKRNIVSILRLCS
jgi:hypothetical protein